MVFSIRTIDRSSALATEQLGSKPKFWFSESNDRRFLFKADDRGTGEDWAEVVACNLCSRLGLPHVEYELAQEIVNGINGLPGVVCANMAPPPLQLVLGNELLLARDPDYPAEQRFKVRKYTIDAVASVIESLDPPGPEWMPNPPAGVSSALDVFVGYVLLDAWIANQDRHHENWASLRGTDANCLAPSFDHGAGLARNLTDFERAERMTTKDANRTIAAFVRKARGTFYSDESATKPLGTHEAFRRFAGKAPNGAAAWIQRLTDIDLATVCVILEQVPAQRMTDVTNEFTKKLLETNRNLLIRDWKT